MCVRPIVEVIVLAEAISAKVRFPGRVGHCTNILALLQKSTIEMLTKYYSYYLQAIL